MTRHQIGTMIRAITGHDYRRRHEGLISTTEAENCRFCNEEEESSDHIVNRCPRLLQRRANHTSGLHWRQRQPHTGSLSSFCVPFRSHHIRDGGSKMGIRKEPVIQLGWLNSSRDNYEYLHRPHSYLRTGVGHAAHKKNMNRPVSQG